MRSLAVLSFHTSPLAQPGAGDGGGMNVYVRQLSAALARAGVEVDVYTRADDPDADAVVRVEPGLRVHHVPAGPIGPVAKEDLPGLIDEFADGVRGLIDTRAVPFPDAIHANYWLSGVAGHRLKHELEIPLVCTFHTLDRVKAEEADEAEQSRRAKAESEVIGCSDAVLASCEVEAEQIAHLYAADRSRIEIVSPGVDHAFFAPGDSRQARRALGLPQGIPLLLFVGRIQPLKGVGVAIAALAEILEAAPAGSRVAETRLLVVGGPSGRDGDDELARLHKLAADLGVTDRVEFHPPQPHEQLSIWYRAADACLVPSRSESFGLVALEAAACGLPVVASAVGGLQTLVEHRKTGYLVEDRDPAAFAAYTGDILSHPLLAADLGMAAAERAKQYTWWVAASRLRRLYDRLTVRELVACQ